MIKQKRALVVNRLNELNKINFSMPTARELHARDRGLGRVQRRNIARYKKEVLKQKAKLVLKLAEIDRYLAIKKLKKPTIILGRKPILKKTRIARYKQRKRR